MMRLVVPHVTNLWLRLMNWKGSLAAPDHEDDSGVPKRRVACRLACEPVEIEPLVAKVERVKRIAHPDAPAGERDLLCGHALGQDRCSAGAAQCIAEECLSGAG